jgi:hypothetical protein
MLVQGDITCLHCGFESGVWTGTRGSTLTYSGLRTTNGGPAGAADSLIRCSRCSGPVLLANMRAAMTPHRLKRIQRMREQLAQYEAEAQRRRAA